MLRATLIGTTLLCSALFAAPASACDGKEKEYLAKFLHELELAENTVLTRAEDNAGSVRKLNYPLLRHDLAKVRLGIEECMYGTSVPSDKQGPITGQYVR